MMGTKKESPERLETLQGKADVLNINFDGKDTPKLSNRQKKIYDLLMAGKHTVTQMTFETGFADPRSYIRELRNRGINVLDEWIRKDDVHFKRYWIKKTDDAL
jgi:hypothetical protein